MFIACLGKCDGGVWGGIGWLEASNSCRVEDVVAGVELLSGPGGGKPAAWAEEENWQKLRFRWIGVA